MIINASAAPLSYPFIGYDNIVTTSNVSASSADGNYPITNVANPALNLKWQAAAAGGDEYINVTMTPRSINYVAIAGHNFGSGGIPVSVTAFSPPTDYMTRSLLHFDTDLTDDATIIGNVWTASGNAAVSTTASRFGRASLFLDGTGDFITTPWNAHFQLDANDFTIEMWIKAAGSDGSDLYFSGNLPAGGGGLATSAWYFIRQSTGVIVFLVGQSTVQLGVTGTSAVNIARGWTHIAAVRQGTTLKLYIDGVSEGGAATVTGAINNANPAPIGIGCLGAFTGAPWNGWIDEFRFTNGIARYTGNFTPPSQPFYAQVADAYSPLPLTDKLVLHFDGPNNSTAFRDETGKAWTANDNAHIETTSGGGAGRFDGVNDWITTPGNGGQFTLGTQNFTIEAWFNSIKTVFNYAAIAGQGDVGFTSASSWALVRSAATGVMYFQYYSTTPTLFQLVGTSGYSDTINPGWHHVAVVRSGNTFSIYLDGVLEASHVNGVTMQPSTQVLTVGGIAGYNGLEWQGLIDDFRFSIGVARYTSNFTPPPRTSRVPYDDGPLVFRFPATVASKVRLAMRPGDAAPQVAVMYIGTLLDMERSIDIQAQHTPINMGRMSRVASGKAENGKFIGRIVLGEWNAGSIDFKWFKPDWYRVNFDPFLNTASENPFFIAWNPVEYPLEVGYVSLTTDAKPEVDPVTKRVGVRLDFQGESA